MNLGTGAYLPIPWKSVPGAQSDRARKTGIPPTRIPLPVGEEMSGGENCAAGTCRANADSNGLKA